MQMWRRPMSDTAIPSGSHQMGARGGGGYGGGDGGLGGGSGDGGGGSDGGGDGELGGGALGESHKLAQGDKASM